MGLYMKILPVLLLFAALVGMKVRAFRSRGVVGTHHSRASEFSKRGSSAGGDVGSSTAPLSVHVPSGLLAVYKPQNWTSSDVVNKIKFTLQRGGQELAGGRKCKIKVGHGGTLDPLAEGVLVLGIGDGTKLMGQFLSGTKEYKGTALLGAETDTLDSEGVVVETVDSTHISRDDLDKALALFRGEIMQLPPMYSALKKDGKKLYELARAGIEVEREKRPVTIYSIELVDDPAKAIQLPAFALAVSCSGGTYIRTLISDIARACKGRAHMTGLVRCKQGPFVLADCVHEQDWKYQDLVDALHRHNVLAGLKEDDLRNAASFANPK